MKKEYLILAVLILGLSLYLVLKKEDQTHYTLPEIKEVDTTQVDKIRIGKRDAPLEFNKTNDGWVIGKEKFPADKHAVDSMLDVVKNLKISALVSDKEDRFRYELDDAHALDVEVFKGDNLLMAFKIGKTAPSFNHTFVMLDKDTRIFHARENFRSSFDKPMDDFRDKTVLKFEEKSIRKIQLTKAGKSRTLIASETKDDEGESRISWKYEDGSSPDREAIDSLLSSLSSLECEKYRVRKKEEENQGPACTIILENDEEMVLNLYDGEAEEQVDGTSSMNAYPFTLQSYTAKDILSHADKILGLEEKKAEDAE
ncbi:DUF4340 domain-containing protein [Desulfospira joergensenii]|uniref:DUF4340 domain-containing protein n=1 Tax=Desulfospira joergensenii TaxID=53329 RepID=UPI0003B398F8|nr:DUF4340 domain-containing protein [Desulfospira joergensenii]